MINMIKSIFCVQLERSLFLHVSLFQLRVQGSSVGTHSIFVIDVMSKIEESYDI